VMALAEFIENQLIVVADYTVNTTVNQKKIMEQNIEPKNASQVYDTYVPLDSLKYPDEINEIAITKDGIGPLYFDAGLVYYPSNDAIQPIEKGLIITRNYYSLEDSARSQPLSGMQAGNLYRGVLTLIVPEDSDYVVAEEYLPAGLKALSFNPAVANPSSRYESEDIIKKQGLNWVKNPLWNFDHYEIKDERILLFAEHLPAGVYEIDYLVQAGLPGKYNHLPASVRQMFDLSVYARTGGEWMEIK
jgi:uncharacterized protein YfaS (alpha-2-macroglobulin family)